MGSLATLHTQHIFDLDTTHSGQYLYVTKDSPTDVPVLSLASYLINQTVTEAQAILVPFTTAAQALPGIALLSSSYTYAVINDLLYQADDAAGDNMVMVGVVYQQLLDAGSLKYCNYLSRILQSQTHSSRGIFGHLVAGSKVAENANISSAVIPAWQTTKTHLILERTYLDSASLAQINTIRKQFQSVKLPILEQMSGMSASVYSNETDVLKLNFQTTFFGPNYAKLSTIKTKYDPNDLFIVPIGVGSER
ncbi:hypothetical protein DFH09DRAFT_1333625 [Mycena vulgaris]|nr:hypothetical protein DFH09DRAFT_1333625 [Mycena vulgaris]